jgi:hypothetical protein
MTDKRADHVNKREHSFGRCLPVFFYAVNYLLWIVITLEARAWGLLWLAVFPLPALALYLVRTGRQKDGA